MVLSRHLGLLVVALGALANAVSGWLPPIEFKGNKMFSSASGEEFRMKGMAYYPRPNGGNLSQVNNYDWFTDDYETVWRPHLEIMKDLGVNTIRLYAVDPSRSHDKFMCACSEAGIYVIIGLAAACLNCAIVDAQPPDCYPSELFTRAQMIYNAFAVYDNTLAFSVGNENNLQIKYGRDGTTTAPCVKAFLRDVRNYADYCPSLRKVPIGLDIADIPPRDMWIKYYDCPVNDNEYTRAEWIGFNPYVECNPREHKEYSQSIGLQMLMRDYAAVNYARPIMFGEYGCIEGEFTLEGWEKQRGFYDAKWMNAEPEMMAEIVGGCVFEFSTEIANLIFEKKITKKADPGRYGIGYFVPANCDHDTIPCEFEPYPEFFKLKDAYLSTPNSTVTYSSFQPSRNSIQRCPERISEELPPTPDVPTLSCSVAQPICNSHKSNAFIYDTSPPTKIGASKPPSNEPTTVGPSVTTTPTPTQTESIGRTTAPSPKEPSASPKSSSPADRNDGKEDGRTPQPGNLSTSAAISTALGFAVAVVSACVCSE